MIPNLPICHAGNTGLYKENKEQILPKMLQIHLFWVPNLKIVTISSISTTITLSDFVEMQWLIRTSISKLG